MIHQAWQSFLEREGDATAAGQPVTAPQGNPRGITWLPGLAVASFEGPDVLRFLQGYLTCDTATLEAGRFVPGAICSLKGRVVVNGWCIAPSPQKVLFVIHESLIEALGKLLQVYLRFSRTRLVDRRDELLVLGSLGLDGAAGTPVDADRRLFLCGDFDAAVQLWREHPHLAPGEWQSRMIADRLPLVAAATSDAFLPQMLNLPELGAISFSKGCYLGQEVVARAQHRGQVKRHLIRLSWHGGTSPEAGSELADGSGRNRGTVIQATGDGDRGTALAVIQDDSTFPLRHAETAFDALD